VAGAREGRGERKKKTGMREGREGEDKGEEKSCPHGHF